MTTHDDLERPGIAPLWLQALTLPTYGWVQPFLRQMGFPETLLPHIEHLAAVAADAGKKRRTLWVGQQTAGYSPELDARINRKVFAEALEALAARVSPQAASDFKEWAQRSIVDESVHGALLAWKVVLRHAAGQGNRGFALLPPPAALAHALPPVLPLLLFESSKALHAALLAASPPYHDDSGMGNDLSPDAMTVEEIISEEQVRAVLRTLSQQLSPTEKTEVLAWAQQQAAVLKIPSDALQGLRFWT
ncbi:MAG: hypothetical protein HXY40_17265 [Chloroflexi bacterium]|nr:hypothetical protein [Chloroflexota bacterium]